MTRVSAILVVLAVLTAVTGFTAAPAGAQEEHTAATIERDARNALALLRENSAPADKIAADAAGILVFPKILKGGLIIGGQYGEGALFQNDAVKQYYSTAAASFGLQAGLTTFGYAVYFMNEKSLSYLDNSDGWEIGTAPNVVVVESGAAGSLTTTSGREDIYVFFFDQKGLMAGLTIEGTKITEINPD
jgi:lipid-binding SYLF domain-containing protein